MALPRNIWRLLSPALWLYICSFLCLTSAWAYLDHNVGSLSGSGFISNAIRLCGDAALLLAPYWLLPEKFRWSVIIPVWGNALWFCAAIWYFRLWGDIPALSALTYTSNLNSELLRSPAALWQGADLAILLPPLIPTLLCIIPFRRKISSGQFSRTLKISSIAVSVLLWGVGQYLNSRSTAIYYRYSGLGHISVWQATTQRLNLNTAPAVIFGLRDNGAPLELTRQALMAFSTLSIAKPIALTDDQREKIDRFISRHHRSGIVGDSLQRANRNKNIILIVVESLNADVLDLRADGREVTPTLNRLAAAPGSVTAENMLTQVNMGGSGDGHLIDNTGMLPLSSSSTSILLGSDRTFPSLARALPSHACAVVFADKAQSWNSVNTFKSFGFETLRTSRQFEALKDSLGGDAALFSYARQAVDSLPRPFFLELLTVSMHTPFHDPDIPDALMPSWIDPDRRMREQRRRYLEMTAYFDRALGDFLAWLTEKGLSPDTMVIIVSDHSQNAVEAADSSSEPPMLFIATNTGITHRTARPRLQIDAVPTVFDLTGTSSLKSWRGLGHSLLMPDSAVTEVLSDTYLRELQELSELMLRSDYFAEP